MNKYDSIDQVDTATEPSEPPLISVSWPEKYNFLLKIVILGDTCVGKTCLLKRFCRDEFESKFLPTIGVDFDTKIIPIKDKMVKLQVWDTAGRSRFQSAGELFLRGVMGVIYCFDISDRTTFRNLSRWIGKIQNLPDGTIDTKTLSSVIVGCKSDCIPVAGRRRQVTIKEAQSLAISHKFPYLETSSKDGDNSVYEVFSTLAASILASRRMLLQHHPEFMKSSTSLSSLSSPSYRRGHRDIADHSSRFKMTNYSLNISPKVMAMRRCISSRSFGGFTRSYRSLPWTSIRRRSQLPSVFRRQISNKLDKPVVGKSKETQSEQDCALPTESSTPAGSCCVIS